jgi:hypothetical protein
MNPPSGDVNAWSDYYIGQGAQPQLGQSLTSINSGGVSEKSVQEVSAADEAVQTVEEEEQRSSAGGRKRKSPSKPAGKKKAKKAPKRKTVRKKRVTVPPTPEVYRKLVYPGKRVKKKKEGSSVVF